MGCKVNNETSSRLLKYKKRVVWITLEKDSKVKVKQSEMPSLYEERYQEDEIDGYPECINDESGKYRGTENRAIGKGHFLDDFYLYFSQKSLPAPFEDIEIEIFGNGLMRKGNRGFPQFCEKFCIPKVDIYELKKILIRAGIFQIKNDYPSNSIDGTYWEMEAHIDGQKVHSKGHNDYPTNWSIVYKAILDCIGKAKKLLNLNRINSNNKVFSILANNPPLWWNNLKNDKEIITEIRSNKTGSYIDCYYNGGCILGKLECNSKGNFKGEIHHKYIPIKLNNKGDYVKYNFGSQQIDLNHLKPSIPYLNNFDNKTISLIKKQVENYYPNKSEKGYQYKFIQKDPYFIDSEFQYDGFCGTDLRIDLVRIDSHTKQIVFIELKKFSSKELFNGGIEKQLNLYKCFITNFESELREYYLDLLQVKGNLGLLSKEVLQILGSNFSSYCVAQKPLLIIVGCTQKWIKDNAEDIKSRIDDYALGCYYFGEVNENCDIKKREK